MERIYKVGTRKSPLALKQVEEFLALTQRSGIVFPYEIIPMETMGDRDKLTPLAQVEGSDFFTGEIDDALLGGKLDLAIHSAKDLPEPLPRGLCLVAVTRSTDSTEALVSKNGLGLSELPRGARVGTSSQMRKTALLAYRPDLRVIDIRGTIGERLAKVERGEIDALIVASIAMMRLGLEHRITERISAEIMPPHPLQGSLAIVIRESDRELWKTLKVIELSETTEGVFSQREWSEKRYQGRIQKVRMVKKT